MQTDKKLKQFIENLCAEHGVDLVFEVFMNVLVKHFRRVDLAEAAERMGLIPHVVGQGEIAGRKN